MVVRNNGNIEDHDDERTRAAVELGRALRALHGDDAEQPPDRPRPDTRPQHRDAVRAGTTGQSS